MTMLSDNHAVRHLLIVPEHSDLLASVLQFDGKPLLPDFGSPVVETLLHSVMVEPKPINRLAEVKFM
jgi:hypothetical protein